MLPKGVGVYSHNIIWLRMLFYLSYALFYTLTARACKHTRLATHLTNTHTCLLTHPHTTLHTICALYDTLRTTHFRRVGSISEVSEVMIRSTYADKAIILECPPGQRYCISNSSDGVTTVTFSPHTDRVVLSLVVSLGPGWKGGSALVGLQLMGVVNAVPLPPLDQMAIELLECEWSVT